MELQRAFDELLAAVQKRLNELPMGSMYGDSEYNRVNILYSHVRYLRASLQDKPEQRSISAQKSSWSTVYQFRNESFVSEVLKKHRGAFGQFLESLKE